MTTYHCRAALLLQKQLVLLQKLDLWGVSINILDDNIFTWKLILSGLKDTFWEGSQFEVLLVFTEEYNAHPPIVSFQTIPMHPNVNSEDGSVCLDCLQPWSRDTSISYVILSLQLMLSEPSFQSPLNASAARVAMVSPNHYKQIVLDCVYASKKRRRTLVHHDNDEVEEEAPSPSPTLVNITPYNNKHHEKPPRAQPRIQVSYEDYLKQWKDLGTTKPEMKDLDDVTPYDVMIPSGSDMDSCVSDVSCEVKLYSHGDGGKEGKGRMGRVDQLKATRIQLLKDIRGNKRGGLDMRMTLPTSPDEMTVSPNVDVDVNPGDVDNDEVNSLLSWTDNLPED